MLQALVPSLTAPNHAAALKDANACCYCATDTSAWAADGACLHCHLVVHLDRPTIDDEAVLGWVPEVSQAALNLIIRELHCRLHVTAGLSANDAGPHHVSRALNERVGTAASILGTSRPSELAQGLALIAPDAYAKRHRLLAGIRVMSVGRFFEGEDDIYPGLLTQWSKAAAAHQQGA